MSDQQPPVPPSRPPLARRLVAEFVGSALLAGVVIGSGIAAQTLNPGQPGLELFESAVTTAAGLCSVILMIGAVSGGHLNPVVSLVDAAFGGIGWRDAVAYVPTQIGGCIVGTLAANAMFGLPVASISQNDRASGGHWLGEVIATFGLLLLIFALARSSRAHLAAPAVGAYIGAAYFFTSSTSFANPAITVGRMFSNSFGGIAPASVPIFVGAQGVGAAIAVVVIRVLYPDMRADAAAVVIPTNGENTRKTEATT